MTVLVQANSFQALGNIVSNTEKCRDLVLAHDIIKHMKIAVNAKKTDDVLLEDIAWCLGNLYRINEHNSSSPASKWDDLTIDVLERLMKSTNEEVIKQSCWALSYFVHFDNGQAIDSIKERGLLKRCLGLFEEHESDKIRHPALRIIGNVIANGNDQQTQWLIDGKLLNVFQKRLVSENDTIKKESVWLISNICAGTYSQIKAVHDANLFPLLVSLISLGNADIAKEAVWAACNVVVGGRAKLSDPLVELGVIERLFEYLKHMGKIEKNSSNLLIVLEAMAVIIHKHSALIEGCNGFEYLSSLKRDKPSFVTPRGEQCIDAILLSPNTPEKWRLSCGRLHV